MKQSKRTKDIIKMAKDQYQSEGYVEVDSNAKLSEGDDNGTYVQAWVWVCFAGTKYDKNSEEPS